MSNSIFKCILVSFLALLPLITQGQSTILLKQIEQPSTGGQVLQSNSSGSPLWRSLGNAIGDFVTTDANGQLNYRTPAQTLSDIGAAPSVHTHDASDITSGVLSVNRIPNLNYIPLSGSNQITGHLIRSVTSTGNWISPIVGLNAVNPETVFLFGVFGNVSNGNVYAYMSFQGVNSHLNAPFRLHKDGYVGLGLPVANIPTERLDVNGQVRIRELPSSTAGGDVVIANANGVLRKQTPSQIVVAGGGITAESDPTVPAHVKAITTNEIDYWNDAEVTTNKAQDFTTVDQTLYPSTQAVVDYINDEKGVAQWNANKLQGTDLLIGSPINGQVLIYDGGWKNLAPPWITGNQTIVLSGDVTGSGATSISTTIANNAVTTSKIANSNVTLAKIQDIASQRLLGNPTGSSTAPSEIALGEGIEFDASTQALTTGFMFGTTANSNTLIKRNSSTIFGADVHYMDRSEMGAAYSVNPNPQDCYVITDQDERLVYTKEGTWKIAMPNPSDYPNRTLKFTLLYRGITVILADNNCDVGNVVVSTTDGTATFSYLQPGNLSTDTSVEDRLYTWIEVQSILFDGNYYWTLVEWGN